jgi:hypothetical protein
MTNREKRESFAVTAVHKQLEIAGINSGVLKEDAEWFRNNTITQKQWEEWKSWFITESRKVFKFTKREAEKEFGFFDLNYGLRVEQSDQL